MMVHHNLPHQDNQGSMRVGFLHMMRHVVAHEGLELCARIIFFEKVRGFNLI